MMQPVMKKYLGIFEHRFAATTLVCLSLAACSGLAQPLSPDPADRTLTLEAIELTGTTRTALATVLTFLPLEPGQRIDQPGLVAAIDELRASELFAQVSFSTRPGSSRGFLILVLEVKDHSLELRWAAGNTDLDGWYLVPIMLAARNPTGRGDQLDLQMRLGLRHSGFLLNYTQPHAADGRDFWGTRLSIIATDRPWFDAGVEYRQEVETGGLAGVYGRRWGQHWLGEIGLNLAGVKVSDHARAVSASTDGSISYDDEIRGDDLPAGISEALGDDFRAIVHVDVQRDTRSTTLRAGSPTAGVWGRLKGQTVLQGPRTHLGLQADFRGYREAPGGVLALRLRGALVTEHAAFYDRLYLGGMYTVRGFPTYSLSAAAGDTWLWSSSLEYRSRILGDDRGTKLAGVLFVDAGASGTFDGDAVPGIAAGAGYGLRLRVWWLDWIGLDVGFPLTRRPIDQRFQATASIGWSF
jgi:outer membrane protein assembly factor BamA